MLHEAEEFAFAYDSLYLGGGTPSLLSPDSFVRIAREFLGPPVKEASLEVNPEDSVDFKFLRELGFNRVSLAAVSFSEVMLRRLGRKHHPRDVFQRVEEARTAGFSNINLDLLFGLPGQGWEELSSDLKTALSLGPRHLSLYLLEVPSYYRPPLPIPSDEELSRMYYAAVEFLEEAGLAQYEVSNFAVEGYESYHNLKYWKYTDYIGLGPGAASLLGSLRWENKKSLSSYLGRIRRGEPPERTYHRLSPQERAKEKAMMGLRLVEGVDLCGEEPEAVERIMSRAREYPEFFVVRGCHLLLRRRYFFIMNSLLASIL